MALTLHGNPGGRIDTVLELGASFRRYVETSCSRPSCAMSGAARRRLAASTASSDTAHARAGGSEPAAPHDVAFLQDARGPPRPD